MGAQMRSPMAAVVALLVVTVRLQHKMVRIDALLATAAVRHLQAAITVHKFNPRVEELVHQTVGTDTLIDACRGDLDVNRGIPTRPFERQTPAWAISGDIHR